MSTTATLDPNFSSELSAPAPSEKRLGETADYRAIHSGALVGGALGLFSASIFLAVNDFWACIPFVAIPLVGIVVSLRSWLTVRKNRELYTGGTVALAGLAMSLLFLTSGLGMAGYIYATEVPDGYQRIDFDTDALGFVPDRLDERAGRPIPEDIMAMGGKKVFIKGYIRPGDLTSRKTFDKFLLVRDYKECCFGDINQLKYYDQIMVQLDPGMTTSYSARLVRVGGVLKFSPGNLGNGPIYYLEADYIK